MDNSLPRETRLHKLRERRNLKLTEVAEAVGIAPSSHSAYENDENKDISLFALRALAKYYNVSADYLIGLSDNEEEILTPIETLHLSDEAIHFLKSGKINTFLLSKIISHPSFRRFMIDAEIYVDRNAESAIQSMNSYLESLRTSLLEEADADPEDLWMRTLKAGQIDEDEYFGHVINTDMMEILRSIREEQKTDKTTVDTTVAAEMEKAVQEAKNLHGTPKEKAIKVLCSRLGIQYEHFTDEEFAHFIKVFESAKNLNLLLKGNQRGKSIGSHSKRKGRGKNKRL